MVALDLRVPPRLSQLVISLNWAYAHWQRKNVRENMNKSIIAVSIERAYEKITIRIFIS